MTYSYRSSWNSPNTQTMLRSPCSPFERGCSPFSSLSGCVSRPRPGTWFVALEFMMSRSICDSHRCLPRKRGKVMAPCCPGGRDAIYFASELGHTHVPRFTRSHHVRGIREVGGSGKARGLDRYPPRRGKVTLVWTTTGCNSGPSPALLLRCASLVHVLAHPFAEIRPRTCFVLFCFVFRRRLQPAPTTGLFFILTRPPERRLCRLG